MKIESFEIVGLLNKKSKISANLMDDINILTGRNGAGKTSVMKLIWYVISGNISLALKEVPFHSVRITTTDYSVEVFRLSSNNARTEITVEGQVSVFSDEFDEDGDLFSSGTDEASSILRDMGGSVFFPTFRRIEGGFTLSGASPQGILLNQVRSRNAVEEALVALARKLTSGTHLFISSMSTVDIVSLLLRQYADLSEVANKLQQTASQEIIARIKDFKSEIGPRDQSTADAANAVIDSIRLQIENLDTQRDEVLKPIEAVRELAEKLFKHIGIRFGSRLSFGDAANAVNSDQLSAGEKQMLSFICYNAFYKNTVFFIDEPELSLHVDWQRQLFSILQEQNSSNQYVIATHSPFIYSKYPDKEVVIDADRGDREESHGN